MRTIVFSPYSRAQHLENGLATFANAKKNEGVELAKIFRWWRLTPDEDENSFDYALFPLFPMRIHSRFPLTVLRATRTLPAEDQKNYTIIIDSDPFIVASYKSIVKKTRPKKIIYRASDPLYLKTSNKHLIRAEQRLLLAADEIWCPNVIIQAEFEERYGDKSVTLRNPMKRLEQNLIRDEQPWANRKASQFNRSYEGIGVFFGKINLDLSYLCKLASANKKYAFVVFGNYRCASCPNNVFFEGYQNLARVLAFMKNSNFFFDLAHDDFGIMEFAGITAKVLSAVEAELPYLISTKREELIQMGAVLLPTSAEKADLDLILKRSKPLNIDLTEFEEGKFIARCCDRIHKLSITD
ncbi:hypothetical protein [Thioclava nitratireducens]|uniref:hypothetical protein n=1 Tax=Thioclava nitratireducens TaxID=1915078 RepID=UPI0012FDD3CA|nr:hypothetical protein [Thioclava nitratireducens]